MFSIVKILKIQLVLILCFTIPNAMMDEFIPSLHLFSTAGLYITFFFSWLYVLNNPKVLKYKQSFWWFIVFYIVYSVFIYVDITVDRKYPLSEMLGCPKSVFEFLRSSLILILYMLLVPLYKKIFDYSFLVKSYILLNLPLIVWFVTNYGYLYSSDASLEDMTLSSLMLASSASNSMLLSILFKPKWTNKESLNNFFYILILLGGLYVWGILAKRGAILWFFVTLMLYKLLISKKASKSVVIILLLLFVSYICMPIIIQLVSNFSPYLADRLAATFIEGDTSGRMNEGGGYFYGIRQFLESPWFGSYFRIVTGDRVWQGMYPHNLIIEFLITMGIFGVVPLVIFVIYIIKFIRKKYLSLMDSHSISMDMVFVVMLLNTILLMMSSGTPLLNMNFWLNFAILLNLDSQRK